MRPRLATKLDTLCEQLRKRASPCPFCQRREIYVGAQDVFSFHVKCLNTKCGASGPPARHPEVYNVPKRFVVKGKVPESNFWPSQEHLEMTLAKRAFRLWQKR